MHDELINSHKTLVRNLNGRDYFADPGRRCNDNIKIDLREQEM
jgi:hypothetical protein